MAFLEVYKERLKTNFEVLDALMKANKKEWAVVTKLLCGNRAYLEEIIKIGAKEICDSRISNLQVVKEIDPSVETVYIKPPAKRSIPDIIQYADASFNTEFETIKMLSEEAKKQGKLHKIIIMIEMGDLREGIMGEDLLDFYEQIFKLDAIKVTGIGTNLNCLSGVLPSQDKLIQLSLYKQLIEVKFNRKIPWVTGGTSITVPMLERSQIPSSTNHFRIGETLFFGANILEDTVIDGMHDDVIKLFAEIIEITEKPKVPIGYLAENPSGETLEVDENDYGEKSYRAIIDVGLLDISESFLIPDDPQVTVIGASSDMLILDLGTQPNKYNIGDLISFKLKYMGALRLFSSDYIEKRLV